MASCKDCIHNKICGHYVKSLSKSKGIDFDNAIEQYCEIAECDNCEYFQNRYKFIELPCKVNIGDIFWAIDAYVKSPYDYFITPYQCLGIKYGCDCIEGDNTIMLLAVGGREYIFGKEAFLTAEEAEQALKERETNE